MQSGVGEVQGQRLPVAIGKMSVLLPSMLRQLLTPTMLLASCTVSGRRKGSRLDSSGRSRGAIYASLASVPGHVLLSAISQMSKQAFFTTRLY